MDAGLSPGIPPELWNVENPAQILALHQSYLDAGADIILTNTFGGSRVKLDATGLGGRVRELNRAAVHLARQAAENHQAYVAGDIGPTGQLMAPLGKLTFEGALETLTEQAVALQEAGVDLFWIETMSDLDEARAAVEAVHRASDLPVFCSFSFGSRGRTMMGLRADRAAESLWPLGLSAIGANCGAGMPPVLEALKQMHAVLPLAPLIAKPNAGLPRLEGDRTIFDMTPADFAAHTPRFVELGARVIGGCCGSTAVHMTAVRSALTGRVV